MIEKMLTVSVKNQVQPIHWHDVLEINLVIKGELDVVRNNRTFHVVSGEMIVLNRDDIHAIDSQSEELIYVQLHFDLEKYNEYIPEIWTNLFYCTPEENDAISINLKREMKSHISNILRLMTESMQIIDAEKKIVYYSIDILSSLKMAFLATVDPNGRELNDEQLGRIWKVIDYIYDNCHRKLTLHEVAQQIYVSDDYLTRLLKKNNGMGFEQFIAFVRAELSIKLLLNTEMSVSDISLECGFSAPRYYNAAFLKNYGCTPAEYRKNNKRNFHIEKQKAATGLLVDEGIEIADVLEQIKKYEILYNENNYIKKNVDLDFNKVEMPIRSIREIRQLKVKKIDFWNYNIQRAMADIQFPCANPEEGVFVWKESDAMKILMINPEGNPGKEIIIKISGLDTAETYIYCREKSPDIPDSIRSIADSGKLNNLNRDIIDNIFNMTYEYGELSSEEEIYMNMDLKEGQMAKIVIQKVSFKS